MENTQQHRLYLCADMVKKFNKFIKGYIQGYTIDFSHYWVEDANGEYVLAEAELWKSLPLLDDIDTLPAPMGWELQELLPSKILRNGYEYKMSIQKNVKDEWELSYTETIGSLESSNTFLTPLIKESDHNYLNLMIKVIIVLDKLKVITL